jgi:hypothetical protein
MTLNVPTNASFYDFDGPYTSAAYLDAKSGVYLITTKTPDGTHKVLDVGESGNVRERVSNHDRKNQWERYKQSGIYASGYYCDESDRMAVEKTIREHYNPPCGDR